MKVAYVGIDILFTVLESLYSTDVELVKIFTCETDNVTEFNTKTVAFAKEHDIPLQFEKITRKDLYELVEARVKFVLFGGYYHRIPVIDELPIVNTHPALLPIGRGAWPMPVTILKGLNKSGVTMHKMIHELDEGDIILQEEVPVFPDDDLVSLSKRQCEKIPGMVRKLVADFDNLWSNALPQTGHAEYWEMPTEKDYSISSDMTFEEADLILRAFMGYECFYTDKGNGEKSELIGATAHRNTDENPPADCLRLKDGYILCDRIRKV